MRATLALPDLTSKFKYIELRDEVTHAVSFCSFFILYSNYILRVMYDAD